MEACFIRIAKSNTPPPLSVHPSLPPRQPPPIPTHLLACPVHRLRLYLYPATPRAAPHPDLLCLTTSIEGYPVRDRRSLYLYINGYSLPPPLSFSVFVCICACRLHIKGIPISASLPSNVRTDSMMYDGIADSSGRRDATRYRGRTLHTCPTKGHTIRGKNLASQQGTRFLDTRYNTSSRKW